MKTGFGKRIGSAYFASLLCARGTRVARLAFSKPKFRNLAFFELVWQ